MLSFWQKKKKKEERTFYQMVSNDGRVDQNNQPNTEITVSLIKHGDACEEQLKFHSILQVIQF